MGKQAEFSKLYDKYINKIYRFIFLKVNSAETAEDLTSETFLRGWRSFEKGKEIDNFQAFLYRIAHNLIVDFYRNKDKVKVVSAENSGPLPDPQPDPEEKAKNDSDILLIRQALAELKEDYQNIIILHYIEDLPVQDIAQITGKSEGNTRVMLHRALNALKKQLEKTTLV